MEVIPLKFIHHDDTLLVGKELVDLASLKRLGFPVPEGLVLLPPQLPLTTVLRAYKEHDRDRFEQSLEIIRRQVYAIAPPESLDEQLKGYTVPVEIVWRDALKSWLEEVRSKVWRLGVSEKLVENLSVVPIFFTGIHKVSGNAFFNSDTQKIVIQVVQGELHNDFQKKIEELVEKIRKKVLTSYIIDWIVDENDLWIVRVYPFTHDIETQETKEKVREPSLRVEILSRSLIPEHIKKVRTSLKIYADLSEGLTIAKDIDGVFIASEKVETDDQKILKLVEGALAVDEQVIFQLADIRSAFDISSSLRLLNQTELLEREIQTFQFAKHHYSKLSSSSKTSGEMVEKRVLQNLHIGVPVVRSVDEFTKIKLLIKNLGVAHVEIWTDFSVPENWIHLDSYISAGLDRITLNLDELYSFLIGKEQYSNHPFYKFEPQTVIDYLTPFMKRLHQKNIRVLLRCEHVLDPLIIKFALSSGLYGLILKSYHLAGANEYISGFERKHILNRQIEL